MGTGRTPLVVAIAVYAVVAVAVGAGELDGADGAYELGRALGAALGGLIIAAIARLVYVRLTPWGRGKPEVAPALFYLAAAITALSLLARIGEESNDDVHVDSAQECVEAEASPLDRSLAGFELGELPAGRRAQLESSFAAGLDAELIDYIESNTVSRDGRPVGFALAIPGMPEDEFDDFEAGFTDSVSQQGGTVDHATIADQEVIVGETAASTVIAGMDGCYAVAVGSADRRSAEILAESLLGG